ncbi:MAG: alpha-amylase family glycosyl hydrolase [Anaerolineaceae bacterium]
MMEFHVSRQSRDRYQFDQGLFNYTGNVIFANFHASRLFAQKINQKKDLVNFPERAVKAGQINAMGLIDEIMHHVISLYHKQKNPEAMVKAVDWLQTRIGKSNLEKTLLQFTNEFPPLVVYNRQISAFEYLQGSTEGIPNQAAALEEMLMLWIENKNPAFEPFSEFFDDSHLQAETDYLRIISSLHDFLDTQPFFGPDNQNLADMVRSPAIAVPHSLTGQLEYIRTRWAELLGRFLYRLLSGLDLIKEEEKSPFLGPGTIPVPMYGLAGLQEIEAFSPDKDWMPRLVLIAKNSYVWLDQLSRKYQRDIHRLDQIPDEELDILAKWGFTGLWLIGLWERSKASAKIKQYMGNQEAISSAYSLAAYQIAYDLGGEEAFQDLRERAWRRGIRLASDMVPNHMGIDSEWVIDHPERFISLNESPFPSYSFNSPDLSPDGRVSIHIEDHYYTRSDAAVVFKRYDHRNGSTQYIYHGNDGTSMPWNDTAQLNYLNPEVREAVIQAILDVARKFPIIRFDAAMTLAKRHYQRLWFPEPGSGGDIPSRAGLGLTREQFDALMPIEFWREVVDRAAVEAPDTLLLAEAFWLMEGYFVRTLGMHRVYNSAFMNLLRNEDNSKYRQVMKNTIEFDPEILKRFVNFMNNPDERTAVDQFGKGDKYFGICVMMATLPGLPMIGHGQIEGFSEKYGMEFRHAYWNEQTDEFLVQRHEREIFPLLHQRSLFAGVEQFLLYDFFTPDGNVNEDVFAYSNGWGSERTLVIYHNKFASTRGWIRTSIGFPVKAGAGDKVIVQRTLGEGLNLHAEDNDTFVIFRDHISGLEYIRPGRQLVEKGMYFELEAYKYHVFMNFRETKDDAWGSYRQVSEMLGGRGVPSIEEALKELLLKPVQQPFKEIANPGYFGYLLASHLGKGKKALPENLLREAVGKMRSLLFGVEAIAGQAFDKESLAVELKTILNTLICLPVLEDLYPMPASPTYPAAAFYLKSCLGDDENRWLPLFAWSFTHALGKAISPVNFEDQSLSWLDEWQFSKILREAYLAMGLAEPAAWRLDVALRLITAQQNWFERLGNKPLNQILAYWLADSDILRFIGVNRYKDVLWFNQESFEELVWYMVVTATLVATARPGISSSEVVETILSVFDIAGGLLKAEKASAYQITRLLEAAEEKTAL